MDALRPPTNLRSARAGPCEGALDGSALAKAARDLASHKKSTGRIMPNLDRRLERIEKWASQKRPLRPINRAVELALQNLSDEHLELFLTGFPAEIQHREPTEPERAALSAYGFALEQELAREESESAKASDPSSDAAASADASPVPTVPSQEPRNQ